MEPASPPAEDPEIRKFDRIIINGVRHELTLTSRRLILAESATGTVRREAEYSRIVLANLGVNNLREPEISLSFAVPGGEIETEVVFFVHLPAGQNVQAADKCMDLLKEQGVPVRRSTTLAQMGPPSRAGAFATPDQSAAGRPAIPDFSVYGPTYARKSPPADGPRGLLASPFIIGGLALAVIIMIVAIASIGGLPGGGKTLPATPLETPAVTIVATTEPTPAITQAFTLVPELHSPVPPALPRIPENGIWLYVASPGNYTGWIKADGWSREINATGTFLTQIATRNTLIEGSVEKTDGTGNPLDVKLYNGGEPVFEESLSKPYGMIQIRQMVGEAIVKNPSSTPVPTLTAAALPTPDPSIEQKPVPSPGIFVRVSYDGEFSGTIASSGYERTVAGLGDQFYHIPAGTTQQVDGMISKPDGSGKSLVVQLYKDGSFITAYGTTKPYGVVEFHTII